MKNLFYFLTIVALIFTGCSKTPISSSQSEVSQPTESVSSSYSSESIETPIESSPEQQPNFESSPNSFPLTSDSYGGGYPYSSFDFNSVEELIKGISGGSDGILEDYFIKEGLMKKEYIKGSVIEVKKDRSLYWEIADSFLTDRIKQNSIYVPFINGEMFNCKSENDIITLFPAENYNRSWLWYQTAKTFSIDIMYLDTVLNGTDIKAANDKGASWLMNKINPYGENSEKQYPSFDESYKKQISLADRNIEAVIGIRQYVHNKMIFTCFVYDDILVRINTIAEFDADLIKSLSFKPVPLK